MSTGIAAGTDRYSIRKSVVVGAPVEQAFAAIGTQEGLQTWLAPDIEFEPHTGARVVFHAYGTELSGAVVEYDPPRRVAFTWNQTPPGWPVPTLLTMAVEPEGAGCRIHIVHSGFDRLPEGMRDRVFAGYIQGWEDDGDMVRLKERAEGAPLAGVFVGSHAVYGADGPRDLAIRMRIQIRAPRERVWKAVASQAGMRRWFNANAELEPRLGGKFLVSGLHDGEPFVFDGQVTALEEPSCLSVTWQDGGWPLDSSLTIRLEDAEGGTLVLMSHHGFERMGEVAQSRFVGFRGGWVGDDLGVLKRLMEEAEVIG